MLQSHCWGTAESRAPVELRIYRRVCAELANPNGVLGTAGNIPDAFLCSVLVERLNTSLHFF